MEEIYTRQPHRCAVDINDNAITVTVQNSAATIVDADDDDGISNYYYTNIHEPYKTVACATSEIQNAPTPMTQEIK